MEFLFYLAAATLFMVVLSIAILGLGLREINSLKDVAVVERPKWPMVSIVIPARDEEKHLEEALKSVLSLDYPNFETIVLNDRSSDSTRTILERLAPLSPALRVFHIEILPVGWLGKNYALYHGAKHAKGGLLLFMDADVLMEKSTLKKSVAFLLQRELDHVVVGAQLKMSGPLLQMMVLAFVTAFMLYFMPWKAKNPKSKRFTGGGSFSLFRREAYEAIGTMKTLAFAVDDDLRLGQLIKKSGFRQEFLSGSEMIFVEWYPSPRAMIRGLTKNTFAALRFSLTKTFLLSAVTIVYYFWPLAALFVTTGVVQLLNAIIVLMTFLLFATCARFLGLPIGYAVGFPIAMAVNVFTMLRSAWCTLTHGGVTWRETFYPLSQLRK